MRVNLIRFLNPKEDWRYYRGSAIFGAAVALGAWYALHPRDDVILPAFLVGGAAGSMLLDFAINRAKDLSGDRSRQGRGRIKVPNAVAWRGRKSGREHG